MNFETFYTDFEIYHQHPITISTHFVCVGIFTMFVFQHMYFMNVLWLYYGAFLLLTGTPHRLTLSSLLFGYLCQCLLVPVRVNMLLLSLVAQYLSHYVANEPTLLSTYANESDFLVTYMSHVLFTIPCVLRLFSTRILFPSNNIVLDSLYDIKASFHSTFFIDWISKKIDIHDQSKTHHWWYDDLNAFTQVHFLKLNDKVKYRLQQSLIFSVITSVDEMNELYVSSSKPIEYNSDNVFYSKHIDGPFYLFPFCSVKRVILALNVNENISTVFPEFDLTYTLSKHEFVSFDFNRDIHYITSNNLPSKEPRITLKLHYLVYPKGLACMAYILMKLNIMYDKHARNLFLYTLSPKTPLQKVASCVVNVTTNLTYYIEHYFGFFNVFLLILIKIV